MQPTPTTIICNACATVFPRDPLAKGRPNVFCSPECVKGGRSLVIRHCMWCGEAYNSNRYNTTPRFCSLDHERLHKQLRDRNNNPGGKPCLECPTILDNPRRKWCSWECMLATAKEDTLQCNSCLQPIAEREGELSSYPRFCDAACRDTFNRTDVPTDPTAEASGFMRTYYRQVYAYPANRNHDTVIPGRLWPRAKPAGHNRRMGFPTDFSVPVHVQRSLAYWHMQCTSGATPGSVATLNCALTMQRSARHPYMPLPFEEVAHFMPDPKVYRFKQAVLHCHRERLQACNPAKLDHLWERINTKFHKDDPANYIARKATNTSRFDDEAKPFREFHRAVLAWTHPTADKQWVLDRLEATLNAVDYALSGAYNAGVGIPPAWISDYAWDPKQAFSTLLTIKPEETGPIGAVNDGEWYNFRNPVPEVRNHWQYLVRCRQHEQRTNALGMLVPRIKHGAVYPMWATAMLHPYDPT